MKIPAVITSILLASSSVAFADHVAVKSGARLDDNNAALWRRPDRLVWSPLSQMITAQRTTTLRLAEARDELRALRFQSGTGATYIYSVTLQFEDGSRDSVAINKWLYWDAPTLTAELPRRRTGVDRVTVHTWTWYPSTYRVFGQHFERSPIPPLPHPLPPPPPPASEPGLVIGSNLTFANSAGYVQLPVGAAKGSFSKLRIDGIGAATYIGRIYVAFPDRPYQTIEVNKPLHRGASLTLDIAGTSRPIKTVTVMAGDDLGAVGHAGSRFAVTLL